MSVSADHIPHDAGKSMCQTDKPTGPLSYATIAASAMSKTVKGSSKTTTGASKTLTGITGAVTASFPCASQQAATYIHIGGSSAASSLHTVRTNYDAEME